jgi:hypothetical protein
LVPLPYVYVSGFCWVAVYSLLVKRGFQDKSYGMPLVALSGNVAWESIFSSVYIVGRHSPGRIIIFAWLVLDAIVVVTFILYGYRYLENSYHLTRPQFYALGVFSLASAYAFFLAAPPFLLTLPMFQGDMFEVASFLAYALNFVISVLFVNMVLQRRRVEGQSLYIGLLKWIGTLIVAIWYVLEHPFPLTWFIVIEIEIFDILYLKLIYSKLSRAGVSPWLRL